MTTTTEGVLAGVCLVALIVLLAVFRGRVCLAWEDPAPAPADPVPPVDPAPAPPDPEPEPEPAPEPLAESPRPAPVLAAPAPARLHRPPQDGQEWVGGYVHIGMRRAHRTCADARRDGRPDRICQWCYPILAGPADPPSDGGPDA